MNIYGVDNESYRLKRVVFAKKIMFFSFFNLFPNAFVLCYYVVFIRSYMSICFYLSCICIIIYLNRLYEWIYDSFIFSENLFFLWRFDVGHENKTYHSE